MTTSLYLAVWCPTNFVVYNNQPSNLTQIYQTNQTVAYVRKTSDQGISYVQGLTLNQFDSQGKKQSVTAPTPNSVFISDSLYVSSDST